MPEKPNLKHWVCSTTYPPNEAGRKADLLICTAPDAIARATPRPVIVKVIGMTLSAVIGCVSSSLVLRRRNTAQESHARARTILIT